MLTRVVAMAALACAVLFSIAKAAEDDITIKAFGVAGHLVTLEELQAGTTPPLPNYATPLVGYVWAQGLKKGDRIELELKHGRNSIIKNAETLETDKPDVLLLVSKRIPGGGWFEGTYTAELTVTRGGAPVVKEQTKPLPLD